MSHTQTTVIYTHGADGDRFFRFIAPYSGFFIFLFLS